MRNAAALAQQMTQHPFPDEHTVTPQGLVASLQALHDLTRPLSESEVRELLSSLSQSTKELAAFERFDAESYCRNRIFSNSFVDILLLCWRPGQRTPIHDHAGSTCGVYVMRGEAIEIGFAPSGMGPLIPSGSHAVSSGEVTVSSDNDIHLVANYSSSGEDLVTVHCYSPPLRSMRVFGEGETFFSGYSEATERATRSGCYHVEL